MINGGRIINIASVANLSPLRYPGGKTWFVPYVKKWLLSLPDRVENFIEPFAGGAIVGLTITAEKLADHVTLVELDPTVASIWKVIFSDDNRWLVDKILSFEPTVKNLNETLHHKPRNTRNLAFQTILRNRVNRGGILAEGAGRAKFGENGRGVFSRWYPKTLARRILNVSDMRERITFIEGDGLKVMREHLDQPRCAFFIDPPYTAAGKQAGRRLYTYWELNHGKLFQLNAELAGDFLMTYEDGDEVIRLAQKHNFDVERVAMKSTHHAQMTELIIGKNLAWTRTQFAEQLSLLDSQPIVSSH